MTGHKQPSGNLTRPLERRFEQLTEPFSRFVSNQITPEPYCRAKWIS